MDESFEFDLFISYSHKDGEWVDRTLLPKLRQWEVSYCIDFQNFEAGRSIEEEMLRYIKASRQALIVLTSNWLGSTFTMFEAQVSKAMARNARAARILILQLDECEPPQLLKDVTIVGKLGLGAGIWGKFRNALLASRTAIYGKLPLHTSVTFWKRHSSLVLGRRPSSYEYEATIEVANAAPVEMLFDSTLLRAMIPPSFTQIGDMADTIRIVFQEKAEIIQYSDRGLSGLGTIDDERDQPQVITLRGSQGLRTSYLPLGAFCITRAGQQVIELSVSLFLGDYEITEPCLCALPPLSRLPNGDNSTEGLVVNCVPEQCLPALSGILSGLQRDRIFETAHGFSADALLLRVEPETVTVYGSGDYGRLHRADAWCCVFSSESKDCIFSISLEDSSWIDQSRTRSGHEKPQAWLNIYLLSLCQLDARLAYLIALQSGCRASDQDPSAIILKAVNLNGTWSPMWTMPLRYGQELAGVTADTGELCTLSEAGWNKVSSVVWNQ